MFFIQAPLPFPCCPYLYLASLVFAAGGVLFGTGSAETSASGYSGPQIVLTIGAVVSLLAALGTQIDSYRKRTMQFRIMEAELTGVKQTQQVHGQQIGSNRHLVKQTQKKQEEIEKSLKGLEELRNVGLLQPDSPPSHSILIVDDDPTWVNQLGRFFVRNLGSFNLLQALDLPTALKEVEKCPSWIFLDIKMGDRSGLEIIPPAKSCNPQARVIVITGWNDPDELQGAVALGAEIWRKPISPEDLHRIVAALRKDFGTPAPSSDAIPVSMSHSMEGMSPVPKPPNPKP